MICMHETYVWGPHPGCREFMDAPEVIRCVQPATHVVSAVCDWNPEPPHEPEPIELPMCEEHAREAVEQEPDVFWHDAVMVELQR